MCYNNVVFKQRVKRTTNRDELEHQRINDRIGFEARFQTAGTLIYQPQSLSSLQISNEERFNKNYDKNDKIKRQKDKEKEDNFYSKRLQKRMLRDQQKWQKYEKNDQKQEHKIQLHKQIQIKNNKNSNSLGYDLINLNYESSLRGQKLQLKDENKQINRLVRSRNIMDKNYNKFNIITGEQQHRINTIIPEKYKQSVYNKYESKKQRQKVKYEPIRDKYDYIDDN